VCINQLSSPGARIELEGETSSDQIDEAWIYFSGGFGEVRIGSDDEALAAFHLLSEIEGIVPALESSHAIAWLVRSASSFPGKLAIVNLSGRGDKDLGIVEGR